MYLMVPRPMDGQGGLVGEVHPPSGLKECVWQLQLWWGVQSTLKDETSQSRHLRCRKGYAIINECEDAVQGGSTGTMQEGRSVVHCQKVPTSPKSFASSMTQSLKAL